jgi:hypothetical protein
METFIEKKVRLLEALVAALQKRIQALIERNERLEPENQGWLVLWQNQQREIDSLNNELLRLQSRHAEPRDDS